MQLLLQLPSRLTFSKPDLLLLLHTNFEEKQELVRTPVYSSYNYYYPKNTNTSHVKSIKGVVRHLRKQYLPKGITFNLIGGYVGEEYLVVVS